MTESWSPHRLVDAAAIRRGRCLVLLAAVMWSTSGFFAKAPWLQAWPIEARGPLLAFWRTLFAGLCLLPLVRRPRWSWSLVPSGVVFAMMSVSFLTAVTKTTAANAIWLQNTAPIWVLAIGVGWLGEKARRADWLMLIPIVFGVGFILLYESRAAGESGDLTGVAWGLASGLLYALVVVSVRALREMDSAWLIAWNHLLTAVLLLPVVIRIGIWPTFPQLLWLAAFGAFQMGIPYTLFARALRTLPSHQASFIVLLEPILVPVWVWLVWRNDPSYEAPQWWTLVGGGCILLGLVIRFARPVQVPASVGTRDPS